MACPCALEGAENSIQKGAVDRCVSMMLASPRKIKRSFGGLGPAYATASACSHTLSESAVPLASGAVF
ncbi:hypothetical protein [Rhodoferax sp.]|uniref:hypothetical protein n=1 Tax=Rhodoferax sp. TaxID=50421 RepID=UPI0025EF905F|nr:hypothetical protein [Rhodoferax sp.]